MKWETLPGAGANAGIVGKWLTTGDQRSYVFRLNNTAGTYTLQMACDANGVAGSATVISSDAWSPVADTWYHVAVVKQGATGYLMFIDGTQIGTTQTDTSTIPDFAGTLRIGIHTTGNYLNGWVDEFRTSKGIARWTGNFTPPTSPYGAVVPQVIWW